MGDSPKGNNVKVVCRFRPPNQKELTAGNQVIYHVEDDNQTTVQIKTDGSSPKFTFDRVFGSETTQRQVYEYAAQPVIEDIMKGYNGTIFVYGQTSSGKTHTMQGPSIEDPELKGIIPRMTNTIFESVQKADANIEFLVKASYIEIYMEKIRDLLDPTKTSLQVREEKTKGIWVEGATEHYVADEQDVLDVIRVGSSNRAIAATNMNFESSRSHSIFILMVQQRNIVDQSLKTGKLYLVDLAGSEKVEKTGAQGTTLDEAKMINKSLSALGNVINSLTDGKSQHVPYRDSKLTRVLQESLGGNSRTTLIINCSPVDYNEAETISTLRFGTRAKSIKNAAKINQERSMGELKILLAKAEKDITILTETVNALQEELKIIKEGGVVSSPNTSARSGQISASLPNVQKLQDQCLELENQCAEYENQLRKMEEEKQSISFMMEDWKEKEQEFQQMDQLKEELRTLQDAKHTRNKENELLIVKLAEMTIESDRIQYEKSEQELLIEKLRAENQNYVTQNSSLESSLKSLQSQFTSREAEWEAQEAQRIKNEEMNKPSADVVSKKEDSAAQKEKEVISSLRVELELHKKEIHRLSSENDQLKKEASGETEAATDSEENKLEKELRGLRDREKQKMIEFDSLKSALLKDLENRCQKVVELEILLDEAREQYSTLLTQVKSSNAKSLQQKCIFLQKNVEQLTVSHQQLVSENSKIKLENQVAEKQLAIRNERIQNLEQLLVDSTEKLNKFMSENEAEKAAAKTLSNQPVGERKTSRGQMSLVGGGRIAKPLRGGGGGTTEGSSTTEKKSSRFYDFFSPSKSKSEPKS